MSSNCTWTTIIVFILTSRREISFKRSKTCLSVTLFIGYIHMRVWSLYLVWEPFGARSETSTRVHIQGPVEQDSSILKPRFKTTHGLFEQDKDRLPLSSPMSYWTRALYIDTSVLSAYLENKASLLLTMQTGPGCILRTWCLVTSIRKVRLLCLHVLPHGPNIYKDTKP